MIAARSPEYRGLDCFLGSKEPKQAAGPAPQVVAELRADVGRAQQRALVQKVAASPAPVAPGRLPCAPHVQVGHQVALCGRKPAHAWRARSGARPLLGTPPACPPTSLLTPRSVPCMHACMPAMPGQLACSAGAHNETEHHIRNPHKPLLEDGCHDGER